ncbi:MAG: hypothetical protein ACLUQ6_03925 [Alistipes onderdonkii]
MRRLRRGLTDTHNLFVPRGQWIFGGTALLDPSRTKPTGFWSSKGIESKGYTFKVSPMIAYALARQHGASECRFIYSRSLLKKLDEAAGSTSTLGGQDSDLNFELNDCYSLRNRAIRWR